jgi:ATP-dependent DNA helicase RecQ
MEKALERVKRKYQINLQLKSEQQQIVENVINGRDCIGVLPTGFGKSLCYVLPPLIMDEVRSIFV